MKYSILTYRVYLKKHLKIHVTEYSTKQFAWLKRRTFENLKKNRNLVLLMLKLRSQARPSVSGL
jgi:hypothetical protein